MTTHTAYWLFHAMGSMQSRRPSTAASRYSKKSESIRIIIGWHSGSPILALNSRTYGSPVFWSSIMPAYRKPLNSLPDALILSTAGLITLSMILSSSFSSRLGDGEYAPIRQYLGPCRRQIPACDLDLMQGQVLSFHHKEQ